MSFDRAISLPSPTGATLNVLVRSAEGPRRGAVQINHGLAEHAERYGRFASFLAARGWHAYAHDHRGHGHTIAPDAPLGRFAGHDGAAAMIADVAAVHDLITRDHAGLPVIVFGHSMGGLIGLNFVARHPHRVAAAAIWNANFSAGLGGRLALALLAWERMRLGADVPSRLLPRLTFRAWGARMPQARTPFDWLSRDPAEVDAYIADPLCGWNASVSMWRDVFALIFAGADDRTLAGIRRDLPLHLVGGAKDPATDGGRSVNALANRLQRLGFSNLASTIYPETRHESLNELNRQVMMEDFAAWAERVSA